MTGDKDFKHHFLAWGYSDDCGNMTGSDVGEYDGCHNWFELKVNGEVIGEAMMNYDRGWEFRFRSDTHKMEVNPIPVKGWDGETYDGG